MAMPESGRLTINGLSLCYIEAGRGPLLLCLHGFPDHAPSFRHQISACAALGYHVVVPYMRGYAPSDIPPHGPYQSAALALDVIGLIDMLGGGRADIIGHDWGAVAAYGAAVIAPQKIGKLVALSIPYGPSLAKALVMMPPSNVAPGTCSSFSRLLRRQHSRITILNFSTGSGPIGRPAGTTRPRRWRR
jgi:pimeloyl-ACP methyl ester carboxylesterase